MFFNLPHVWCVLVTVRLPVPGRRISTVFYLIALCTGQPTTLSGSLYVQSYCVFPARAVDTDVPGEYDHLLDGRGVLLHSGSHWLG